MIKFQNVITIEKPIDEVFPFVANLENIPQWNYFVIDVSKSTEGDIGVGSAYHQTRNTDSQDLRIVEIDPQSKLTIETIPPSRPALTRQMVFRADNGHTHIEDNWELETGMIGLLEGLAARRVKNAVLENLTKLRELLETGHTILQDGRRSRL